MRHNIDNYVLDIEMASVIFCSLSIFFLSDTAPSIWGACAEGAYENMYRLGGRNTIFMYTHAYIILLFYS